MKRNMWHWILLLGLSVLLLGSVVACGPTPGSAPTAQTPPAEQQGEKPAKFEVSALTVKPATVMVGYPTTVTATVTNSGDVYGAYEASLMIDGEEVDRKVATVAPASNKEVGFQVNQTTAGTYEIVMGDSNVRLTVCDWTPQTIEYDSGEYTAGMWGTYLYRGLGHIVHFTPLAPPFKIQKISISAFAQVNNFADLSKRMFTVRIWDENKTQQLWSDDFPWSLFIGGGWKEIDVPDVIADGDFHVEVVTNSVQGNFLAVNYEESKGELRSGVSNMGRVYTVEEYAVKDKRWFIRVKGQGPPETCIPEKAQAEVEEEATSELEAESPVPSSKLLYVDDFSNPNRGFLGDIAKTCEIYNKDNEYHILVKERDWSCWDFNYIKGPFTDFALEIDATLLAGLDQSSYGLIFRVPVTYEVPIVYDFYRFLVDGNGYYLIGKRTNGQWTVLKDWTRSEFIKESYITNHLKVVCKGSQIEAYANGHYLTTVIDESFADGRVGVIVYTPEPGAHVVFDNLKVYIPD
jgi:hypothetical protein